MPQDRRGKPIRVVIVGGGCAGIAAAWQLSQQPGYEVHVYEKSWRLGGKGASVRDREGRILEHGLHVWMGFYENAFRMMRECYDEVQAQQWGPDAKPGKKLAHRRIDDAFFPEPHIGVARPVPHGDWTAWSGYFPPAKGMPGDVIDERSNPFTLVNYLLRCFELLKTLMLSDIGAPKDDVPGKPRPEQRSTVDETINLDFSVNTTRSLRLMIERMARLLRGGALTTAAAMLQAVTILEVWLQQVDFAPQVADSALQLMEAVAAQARKQLRDVVAVDPEIRTRTEVIDIVLTIAVGLFRDRVLFDDRGLDAINYLDYRNWLLQHGATKTSVDSPFVKGAYDLVFAYREGHKDRPALAAGVALRGALRMFFTYRGSMFWRMRSGMGDAVFAPLYRVLLLAGRKATGAEGKPVQASPVTFHFLHELEKVDFDVTDKAKPPDKAKRYVSALMFRTRGDWQTLDGLGAKALDDFGCWPDNPELRFDAALKKGNGSRSLSLGVDFDRVVFATGVDAFRKACAAAMQPASNELPILPAEWAKMVTEVKTVSTVAAQVWLGSDLEQLGWYRGSGLITALDVAFDTWADMTHTLPAERAWRDGAPSSYDNARSVAYFCTVLSEKRIDQLTQHVHETIIAQANEVAKSAASLSGSGKTTSSSVGRLVSDSVNKIEQALLRRPLDALARKRIEAHAYEVARIIATEDMNDEAMRISTIQMTYAIEQELVGGVLEREVDENLTKLLTEDLRPVWPKAFTNNSTAVRFEIGRHVQANYLGSDRYTLSLPGSIAARISPLDVSVRNMTIAGDWTACGLDAGCVEAAVMSGMLAAHAISGEPKLESIIGYDHP